MNKPFKYAFSLTNFYSGLQILVDLKKKYMNPFTSCLHEKKLSGYMVLMKLNPENIEIVDRAIINNSPPNIF